MEGFGATMILVGLGFVPSLIWLSFYYGKDPRPEPKYLVSKVFFLGIILAPLVVVAQLLFREAVSLFSPGYQASTSLFFFVWAAFIEEAAKFLPVKFAVLHNPEFDEPVDAMIYMIAAALGFAAIENVLVLFQSIPGGVSATFQTWTLRFVGATLLHAVSSAVVGYFLALSWFYKGHSRKLILSGITVATVIHFTFNITLLKNEGFSGFFYSTVLLVGMIMVISFLFAKIKRERATLADKNNLSTKTALP